MCACPGVLRVYTVVMATVTTRKKTGLGNDENEIEKNEKNGRERERENRWLKGVERKKKKECKRAETLQTSRSVCVCCVL